VPRVRSRCRTDAVSCAYDRANAAAVTRRERSALRSITLRLLVDNRPVARLWLAQAVSLVGDWFTLIALAVLVTRASGGSGLAVGVLMLTQLVPFLCVGPWSGVLVDRYDRQRLLVASDLVRAALVLLFIPAMATGRLWPLYLIAFAHYSASTVFEPARTALLPRLVAARELVAASTLTSVTWSVMTAFGGLVGATILSAVDVATAFTVDAATFVASALLIRSIVVPPVSTPRSDERAARPTLGEGLRYTRRHPVTGAALLIKGINGIAFIDTFLMIYATRVFSVGRGGAFSLGLLYAVFGLGGILGPALLNLVNDGSVRRMRRLVVAGSALITCGLLGLGLAHSLPLAALAICVRGMGGSTNWTYSTIILQKTVPDRFRGRLFALDLANVMLAGSASSVAWGLALDRFGLRPAVFAAAAVSALAFLAWTAALPWMERAEAGAGAGPDPSA
jgi:MFS family permease